jgi:hypothetical protein
MAIKANAQQVLEDRFATREGRKADKREHAAKIKAEMRHSLHKLLSGEPMTAEEGRAFFWEVIANATIMHTDPMTGNAQTYFRLGERAWPEMLMKLAKDVSIDLYHKMEKESIKRHKREVE